MPRNLLVFAVAASLTMAGAAQAVKVVNTTTGQTVFMDDFESELPGAGPVADIGSWNANGPSYNQIQTGAPPAAQGNNYLATSRFDGFPPRSWAQLSSLQNTMGDNVHMEWMMNIPARTPAAWPWASPSVVDEFASYMIVIGAWESAAEGPAIRYLNAAGSAYVDTGWDYSPGQWQRWEFDHVIGSPDFTLKVDSQSIVLPMQAGTQNLSVNALSFEHLNYPQTYYVDATPEPASLLLLALGGFGLALRRRTA